MIKKHFFVLLIFLTIPLYLLAADLSGNEILGKIEGSSALTGSGSALVDLKTVNKNGQEKVQSIKIYRLESTKEEKQLIEFLAPSDVKGTKFLSLRNLVNQNEEMWLYLPALKRERRIAGHMTQDNFMGTDFTFDEISGSFQNKYSAKRLKDDKIGSYECYTLELEPKDTTENYKLIKIWVWQSEMIPLKIEFYNKDHKLWKVMLAENIEKQKNGSYLPLKITMENKLAQTKTIIEIRGNSSDAPSADYFTMQYLRK